MTTLKIEFDKSVKNDPASRSDISQEVRARTPNWLMRQIGVHEKGILVKDRQSCSGSIYGVFYIHNTASVYVKVANVDLYAEG